MEEHFRDVDWVDVYERVTLAALRMFAAAGMVGADHALASFGVGPEDMAGEVLCALLDPTNEKVVWNSAHRGVPTTIGVVKFLVTVMRHDFRDKVRAKRRKRQDDLYTDREDEDGNVQLRVDPRDQTESVETRLIVASLRKRLDDDFLAKPDDELQLYVMTQFDDGRPEPYPPREAAAQMGVPVERIYLLKEKLERRLLRLFKDELEAAHLPNNEKRRHEQEAR
jgi:DNA-directed RNA polymerase specialized sigma24 family protein